MKFPLSPLPTGRQVLGRGLALLNMTYFETTDLKCMQQPTWNIPPNGRLFNRVEVRGDTAGCNGIISWRLRRVKRWILKN